MRNSRCRKGIKKALRVVHTRPGWVESSNERYLLTDDLVYITNLTHKVVIFIMKHVYVILL